MLGKNLITICKLINKGETATISCPSDTKIKIVTA